MTTDKAIITYTNYPEGTEWLERAIKRMDYYAEKCGARFIQLKGDSKSFGVIERGEIIANAVECFDRCLVLDADVMISRAAPSIFEEYPISEVNELGVRMVLDSLSNDPSSLNRMGDIVALQSFFGPLGWSSKYHNAGVIYCSGRHHEVFREWAVLPPEMWPDQGNINYRARKLFRVFDLPPEWNRFSLNTGHMTNTPEALIDILKTQPYIAHAAGHKDREMAMRFLDEKLP